MWGRVQCGACVVATRELLLLWRDEQTHTHTLEGIRIEIWCIKRWFGVVVVLSEVVFGNGRKVIH